MEKQLETQQAQMHQSQHHVQATKASLLVIMQIKHMCYIYITSRLLVDKLYALGNTIISLKLNLQPSGVNLPAHQHCCRKSLLKMYVCVKKKEL